MGALGILFQFAGIILVLRPRAGATVQRISDPLDHLLLALDRCDQVVSGLCWVVVAQFVQVPLVRVDFAIDVFRVAHFRASRACCSIFRMIF